MTLPSLLVYEDEEQYHDHFKREYCCKSIITFDGIRVYFDPARFYHTFYESSDMRGSKDVFSLVRAQRMSWIKITLESAHVALYQGWDSKKGKYDPTTRVCVEYEQFVVVIQIMVKNNSDLKGKFVTCYQADRSIWKIRRAPMWKKEDFIESVISAKKKGR